MAGCRLAVISRPRILPRRVKFDTASVIESAAFGRIYIGWLAPATSSAVV